MALSMPLAKLQYEDLILTGIFYTWLFLDLNWVLVFLLSACIFPYASQSDSFIFHQWPYTTGFPRLASIRMNQELQYVSNLLVLTQSYIYQCCLCCRCFLCACMPGETKHNLKIIIPAWLSMMIIIPVWRAGRTESTLRGEEKLLLGLFEKRLGCTRRIYIPHTHCVFWILNHAPHQILWRFFCTWTLWDNWNAEMYTVKFGYFISNIQIIPLTSLILGVQEEKPLARVWRTGGRWGQDSTTVLGLLF